MRVEARGPKLRVFVANMSLPILEVVDATFTNGWVGVRHYTTAPNRAHAAFSKIAVVAV